MLEQQDELLKQALTGGSPAPRPKRRWWIWLAIVVVVGVGIYYFRSQSSSPTATNGVAGPSGGAARGPMVVPVVAASARQGDIGVFITGLGAVIPISTVTVRTQISGYLMKVAYKEGDIVHQGDPLAEIDSRPYQVMLEQAEAGLAKDQANLDNARVDLARYQTLAPLKAVPEQQLATQAATVKQFEGTVKADQAQIDAAKLDLVYCHIVAPITGRVGLRLIDPGNYVTSNDSTGLVVITQIQPISVIFPLGEDQLPAVLKKLRAGARLRLDAYDREGFESGRPRIAEGWLATVDNQIDPSTGNVRLRANFDNKDGALFPNQFVNVRLLVEDKRGVTLVPTAGVQRNSQTTYAYLVKADSTVTIRPITIGTTEGSNSEVTSGLAPGDVVVMTGVDKVQEGSKVRVQMVGEGSKRGN
ncbi:MAG: efflux RND transporter periplasmic adaptor subunit [Terriglobia bacterium]